MGILSIAILAYRLKRLQWLKRVLYRGLSEGHQLCLWLCYCSRRLGKVSESVGFVLQQSLSVRFIVSEAELNSLV